MIYVLALAGAISTTAVGHLLFRRAARQLRLAPFLPVAACFASVPIMTWIALHGLSLVQVYMATAALPILIAGLGHWFLGERISQRALAPYLLIAVGCLVFYL